MRELQKHKHISKMELFTEIDNYQPKRTGFGKSSFSRDFENQVISAIQSLNKDIRFSMANVLKYRTSDNMPKKPSQQIAQKFHDLVRKAGYQDSGIVHYEKDTDSIILELSKKIALN